jgi:glyoxylase-like metal-dependent hydrolase (beta-lactamase superfamily II)
MLVGDNGNIVVQTGEQGVFVVDTGVGTLADKVIAAIRQLSPRPIQFVANTSAHAEHVGGNAKISAAGADLSLPGSFFAGQGGSLGGVTGFFSQIGSTRR